MRICVYLASSMFLCLILAPHYSHSDPILKIAPVSLFEREQPTVKIHGVYVAGVIFAEGVPTRNRPSLRARVPQDWASQKICVRGKSRDGIYESRYEYQLPAEWKSSAVVEFQYPTSYSKRIRNADKTDFGVSIQKGGCDLDEFIYLVGYWNSKDQNTATDVLLLLNSVSADEAFVFVGDDPAAEEVPCKRLENSQSKGFDFQCILPVDQLVGKSVEIEVNTSVSGVRDPAITVTLKLE